MFEVTLTDIIHMMFGASRVISDEVFNIAFPSAISQDAFRTKPVKTHGPVVFMESCIYGQTV